MVITHVCCLLPASAHCSVLGRFRAVFLTVIGSHGCRLVVAEVGRQMRMSERGSGSDALGGHADADVKRKLEFRQCRGLPDVGYIGSCGSQGYCHVPVLLLS